MKEKNNLDFVFARQNYILLIVGIALIGIGLFLMIGGGSNDPTVFSKKIEGYGDYELFNTQRLIIAPLLIAIGFIVEIFAIMHKAKEE